MSNPTSEWIPIIEYHISEPSIILRRVHSATDGDASTGAVEGAGSAAAAGGAAAVAVEYPSQSQYDDGIGNRHQRTELTISFYS